MDYNVSIIIPNFNRASYLKESLESVVNQNYTHWEVLVVDDGSSDESKKIVANLIKEDARVKWIERKGNLKGASVCRNLGIKEASGDFVVFLDSDDLLASHCLEQRLEIMNKNPELDFAVFKMQFFENAPGDDQRLWNLKNKESELQRFLKLDAVWQTSGPIWKREALLKIGGFNPHLACWQDIDIHLKALFANLNYKLCYDLPVDCYYRKNSTESISQSSTNSPEKLKSKIKLYHWVAQQANVKEGSSKTMALNILLSALNGKQLSIFNAFYASIKITFPKEVQNTLNRLYFIKKAYLYKFPWVQKYYDKQRLSMISKSTIGMHHV